MKVRFIAQPHENVQLGPLLLEALTRNPGRPTRVVIVSAFASRAAILRLKKVLLDLHAVGASIRLVVGVDMGGTSKEVLRELTTWPIEIFVFKNKRSGVTFHPKLYLIESADSAEIFLGSNNLTDGGLYGNYEGTAQVSYSLPNDAGAYSTAQSELSKFIDPKGPVAKKLDTAYLEKLVARNDIPTEAEAAKRMSVARVGKPEAPDQDDTFGYEATARPAPLPVDFQKVVIAANTHQMGLLALIARRSAKKAAKAPPSLISATPVAQLTSPTAFYMELNATKGTKATAGGKANIPGEQRIPLEAVWSAKEFWGWPVNYKKSVNPRKGKIPKAVKAKPGVDRVYHNWHPVWDISQVDDNSKNVRKPIRMYFYENSSDFRFTSGDVAKWGDPGDIVRITKVDDGQVNFKCELAKVGTAKYAEWKSRCVIVGRSDRSYGFA